MENTVITAATLGGSVQAADLSMFALFLRADIVVQLVMGILVVMSVWSWAIIFEKTTRLRRLNAKANEFEEKFWSGSSLEQLFERIGQRPGDPMAAVFITAMNEWKRTMSQGASHSEGMRARLSERVDRIMQITVAREMDRAERYITVLASTGSTAPFLGLFGTVWGIMNSFQSIASTKNTSLAVVAPGIAEALFATALGLVAAIPAVIAFNKISKDLDRYAGRLETFAGEFTAILSRQMEHSHADQAHSLPVGGMASDNGTVMSVTDDLTRPGDAPKTGAI